ncbi:hypothetical protein EIN_438070, partial [Entamoeba invadens IP1]
MGDPFEYFKDNIPNLNERLVTLQRTIVEHVTSQPLLFPDNINKLSLNDQITELNKCLDLEVAREDKFNKMKLEVTLTYAALEDLFELMKATKEKCDSEGKMIEDFRNAILKMLIDKERCRLDKEIKTNTFRKSQLQVEFRERENEIKRKMSMKVVEPQHAATFKTIPQSSKPIPQPKNMNTIEVTTQLEGNAKTGSVNTDTSETIDSPEIILEEQKKKTQRFEKRRIFKRSRNDKEKIRVLEKSQIDVEKNKELDNPIKLETVQEKDEKCNETKNEIKHEVIPFPKIEHDGIYDKILMKQQPQNDIKNRTTDTEGKSKPTELISKEINDRLKNQSDIIEMKSETINTPNNLINTVDVLNAAEKNTPKRNEKFEEFDNLPKDEEKTKLHTAPVLIEEKLKDTSETSFADKDELLYFDSNMYEGTKKTSNSTTNSSESVSKKHNLVIRIPSSKPLLIASPKPTQTSRTEKSEKPKMSRSVRTSEGKYDENFLSAKEKQKISEYCGEALGKVFYDSQINPCGRGSKTFFLRATECGNGFVIVIDDIKGNRFGAAIFSRILHIAEPVKDKRAFLFTLRTKDEIGETTEKVEFFRIKANKAEYAFYVGTLQGKRLFDIGDGDIMLLKREKGKLMVYCEQN